MLKKIKDVVIYRDENYNSFPNAIVLEDGTIMVCFRQARDWQEVYQQTTHGDPSSIGVFVKSSDNGETWSPRPQIMARHFLYGIQDPCLNLLSDGTLLGTFFMWKFTEKEHPNLESEKPHFSSDFYDMEMMDAHSTRSTDQGETWDAPVRIDYEGKGGIRSSVRGNVVELPDGSVLLGICSYFKDFSKRTVFIVRSTDQGKTWTKCTDIVHPDGHFMGEPNLFRAASGRIACLLRTHIQTKDKNPYEDGNNRLTPMHICFSNDDGQSWTLPEPTKYTSPSPFHVLQLKSGNALMTYGHRHSPFGIKAVLLDGELSNLHTAEEHLVRDDGMSFDLGYTSSVQMPNGDILITYYIYHKNDTRRYIAGTILREA